MENNFANVFASLILSSRILLDAVIPLIDLKKKKQLQQHVRMRGTTNDMMFEIEFSTKHICCP
jgi:hypothetical protein